MLEERIYKDYIQALKSKEKEKFEFLGFLRAELKNKAISLRKEKLEDKEVIEILRKQKKKLLEFRDSVEKSSRQDILAKLDNEISIIEEYLPTSLSKEEISKIVEELIKEVGASSLKDMGKVMKVALERVSQRAEAKDIAQIVKEKLSSLS